MKLSVIETSCFGVLGIHRSSFVMLSGSMCSIPGKVGGLEAGVVLGCGILNSSIGGCRSRVSIFDFRGSARSRAAGGKKECGGREHATRTCYWRA